MRKQEVGEGVDAGMGLIRGCSVVVVYTRIRILHLQEAGNACIQSSKKAWTNENTLMHSFESTL